MGVTAEQLRRAQRDFERDHGAAENSRTRRNEVIREALEEGWTHQQIADAMGISRGRVGQLRPA